MVNADELVGKRVVSVKGDEIGKITDIIFELKGWQITHLQLKLTNRAAVALGFKKTIGSYSVCMPVELVSSIGDVITINKTLLDIASGTDIKECIPRSYKRIKIAL